MAKIKELRKEVFELKKSKENKKYLTISILFTEKEWETIVKADRYGFSVTTLAKNGALSHIEQMVKKIEDD